MKRNLFLALGALVALSSCSKEADVTPSTETNKVTFEAGDIQTRVSGSQFEYGDIAKVEAYSSNGAVYATENYTYDGNGTFSTLSPIVLEDNASLSYAAAYPSTATSGNFASDFNFTIKADQSGISNYESSDLLVAKVAATSSAKPTLSFFHTMSTINVTLNGVSASNCTIALQAKNNATVNIADASYVEAGSVTTLNPYKTSTGFCVIVAPQTLAASNLATITVGGETYTWTLDSSSELLSGYRYNYTWTIDQVAGTSDVEFTGLINDWNDGEWNSGSTGGGDQGGDQGGSTGSDEFTLSAETMGYAGAQDASGTVTVGGITWSYTGVSATDSYGTTYLSNENSGYIMNTTALSGNATTVTVTGNGYVNANLVVTVGSSANPSTVLASTSPDGSGWGSEYVYEIPAGTTYIKFAVNSASDHDAGISSITFGESEGGSTGGGDQGGSTGGDQSEVGSVLVSIDGTEYTQGAYIDGEEFTADGYTFIGELIANFESLYDTSVGPIQFKKSGSYLYNSAAISGLTQIAITSSSEYNNFTVYAGSTLNPTSTTVINANEGTSGTAGDIYTYTIPTGSTYFTIANDSSYASYADLIEIYTK
ncbi:MAG: fimbrillin family protein [Rikenellaceae bacterium]